MTRSHLEPLNNREQKSIIQSKIPNRKSLDRTCGIFPKNAIGQPAVFGQSAV
ncbi:hypothetical protein Q5692_06675 [Microcoleus sp. C2C3]|uniref:hypothetical protein n=1 Tax=unclassified Microcoleus TaxID=2642155 RepID=UPI002FD27669